MWTLKRWACFGREASETREPYSNRPGHFFLRNYIFFFICVTKFGTPTSHEPDVVETCGLRHFVALSCAKVMNISNFGKWARERAEGRKTDFSWPSLTREPFDLESWTLSHFVAQSIPNLVYTSKFKYEVLRERARRRPFMCFIHINLERLHLMNQMS